MFPSGAAVGETQPRSQLSSAISDLTSPVKLVGKIHSRFQASSYNSDSGNWPGYEAGEVPLLFCRRLFGKRKDPGDEVGTCDSIVSSTSCKECPKQLSKKGNFSFLLSLHLCSFLLFPFNLFLLSLLRNVSDIHKSHGILSRKRTENIRNCFLRVIGKGARNYHHHHHYYRHHQFRKNCDH